MHFEEMMRRRGRIEGLLARTSDMEELRLGGAALRGANVARSLADWIRFPEVDSPLLCRLVPELRDFPATDLETCIQDYRYAPYVERQRSEIARMRADDNVRIPPDLDFATIGGLSTEMVERLSRARPTTLGAAARIRGITPAALAAIVVHARRKAA